MPHLRTDTAASRLIDTPATNNFIMRNPFMIFRLVMLALLANFAFLSLIFASWNIRATASVGFSPPSTSIFIIFESCLVFFCVTLAVLSFFYPNVKTARTLLECGWAGLLSMFHTGAAISASINGPALACHVTSDWDICASSSLLMPLTWLSAMLSLAYFLSIFIATMAHKTTYPDIWKRTVYDVEWFGRPDQAPSQEKVVHDFLHKRTSYVDDPFHEYYEDVEANMVQKRHYTLGDSVDEAAPWSALSIRRGVDPPFSRKQGSETGYGHEHLPSNLSLSSPIFPTRTPLPQLPPLPPLPLSIPSRSATVATSGSRFVEKFRESGLLMRVEDPGQYTAHYLSSSSPSNHAHTRSDSFPPAVVDVDQPIPLPRLSEWVRADGLKGMIVHSNPSLMTQ